MFDIPRTCVSYVLHTVAYIGQVEHVIVLCVLYLHCNVPNQHCW